MLVWSSHPGRELVRVAWPIAVSTLSYSTMTLASTAFVAQLGSDELAAVGLGAVVGFGLACFGVGLLRAAKTLVSQAVGADRRDRIPALFGSTLALAVAMGVAAAVVATVVAPWLATITESARSGGLARDYLAIRALGIPLMLIYVALRETSYGEGDSRTPMRASLVGNGVNIALDALLIVHLEWGVRGAAVAAVAGHFGELATLAWPMRDRLRGIAISRAALRAVWAQGVPNGLQFVLEVGSFLILTLMVAGMSPVDAAAHQLVLHIVNVSYLPSHALGEAVSVLVGQAVGAGEYALVLRVARRALLIGTAIAVGCSVVLVVGGSAIVSAMANGDGALAARSYQLVHVGLAFLVADAASVIARGALRGASDVRYAAILGIVTAWLCTPPATWLLGVELGWGVVGGWIGLAIEIIVGATLCWWRVWRGGWHSSAAAARRAIRGVSV